MIQCALLTALQFCLNLTFRAWPVGPLADLFLSLVSTEMTSRHSTVHDLDKLGSMRSWQHYLPDYSAGQFSPLST